MPWSPWTPLTEAEIAELHRLNLSIDGTAWMTAVLKAYPSLLDEVVASRAMLKRLEWSRISEATGAHEVSCPICKGPFGRHELDCELALLTWPTSRGRSMPSRR